MIMVDKLCYTSKLRYINAGLKSAFAVITLVLCVISRSMAVALIVLFATGILTVYYGRIPFSRYIRLMRVPLVFLFLSTIAIIINYSDVPLSCIAVPFFGKYLTTSLSSCLFAAQLILTALASVSCLYFLSLSTPVTDILMVLQQIHCPEILVELMLLIYRFIFILLDIAEALTIAQHSRLGNKNIKTSIKAVGSLMAVLLVRAFKKSSYLYDAMESRCYDGTVRVLQKRYPLKKKQVIVFVLFEIFLFILVVYLKIV